MNARMTVTIASAIATGAAGAVVGAVVSVQNYRMARQIRVIDGFVAEMDRVGEILNNASTSLEALQEQIDTFEKFAEIIENQKED